MLFRSGVLMIMLIIHSLSFSIFIPRIYQFCTKICIIINTPQTFPVRKACGRLLCLLDEDITLPLTSEYKCDLPSATVLDTSARCSKSESWLSRSEALPLGRAFVILSLCGGYIRDIAFGSSIGLVFLMPFLFFLQLSSYIVP